MLWGWRRPSVCLQDKSKRLEEELEEERSTTELLTERINRSRDQVGRPAEIP